MAAYDELGYALEKFGQAINDLADRPGKPQDRLRAARLRFFTVRSAELPAGELRDLYVGIRDDLPSAALERMTDEKAFELIERVTAYYRKLRDAWYSRPLAPADEYTGAVIHPIIEPVLSPDGATVAGGRRVGAIATIFGTDEKLQQAPGESDEAFAIRVRAAPPKLGARGLE